jgi:hypothetical protein
MPNNAWRWRKARCGVQPQSPGPTLLVLFQAILTSTYHVFLEMLNGFALLVLCSWPSQASLYPEFIKLVLGNSGVGLEDDTVVVLGLALDIQKDLER